jgi:multidrug efflux system membrane fusion protein
VLNPLRASGLCLLGLSISWAAGCGTTSGATPSAGATGGRGGRGAGTAPVPVVIGKVTQKDVPVDIVAIGNVEAFSTISVRSQITGTVTEVRFTEGDTVKAGAHLFTIDPRPFDAVLQQAQANLARDRALLAQAEAQLNRDIANADYARKEADRQSELVARGIISRDVGEQAVAAANAGSAGVSADKAAIESAKAQLVAQQSTVDSAKLQLDYTIIRSPIDGRTGNLMLKAGNLVTANSTELITITQVDPVYVTFAVPAVHLQTIKRAMAGADLAVAATAQDPGAQPVTGRLSFVDNTVDAATDTIKLKATFRNSDRLLWPGQFAHVSVRLGMVPHASVVPAQAVQTGQDGQFVFVVKADSTVEQRTVTTGETADQDVVITSGLQPGETVVVEGQLRLEPGTRIMRADPRTGEASPTGGRGGRGAGRGPGGGAGQNPPGPGRHP